LNGESYTDGEQFDGELRNAFFNQYTINGTYNFFDGIHYNLTLNAFTNWAIINTTRDTLYSITQERNFNSCVVANFTPVCYNCNQSLVVPFRKPKAYNTTIAVNSTVIISNNTAGATGTNTTATNTTVTVSNTTNTTNTTTVANTTVTNNTNSTNSGAVCSAGVAFCQVCNVVNSAVTCTACQDGYYVISNNTCQPCTQILPNCAVCSIDLTSTVNCITCFFGFDLNGNACN
jgi:hypothetical protein